MSWNLFFSYIYWQSQYTDEVHLSITKFPMLQLLWIRSSGCTEHSFIAGDLPRGGSRGRRTSHTTNIKIANLIEILNILPIVQLFCIMQRQLITVQYLLSCKLAINIPIVLHSSDQISYSGWADELSQVGEQLTYAKSISQKVKIQCSDCSRCLFPWKQVIFFNCDWSVGSSDRSTKVRGAPFVRISLIFDAARAHLKCHVRALPKDSN
jgi:hypothetical protein